jgi:hypothetical protein
VDELGPHQDSGHYCNVRAYCMYYGLIVLHFFVSLLNIQDSVTDLITSIMNLNGGQSQMADHN